MRKQIFGLWTTRRVKPAIACLAVMLGIGVLGSMLAATSGHAQKRGYPRPGYFMASSSLGSYLAGRHARAHYDMDVAASYYQRALRRDPGNVRLLAPAMLMEISEGNWGRAVPLARRLVAKRKTHRIANLLLGLRAFKKNRLKTALKHFTVTNGNAIGELTGVLSQGWVHQARRNPEDALKALRSMDNAKNGRFLIDFHKALIASDAGMKQTGDTAFAQVFKTDRSSLRVALAYARHAAKGGNSKLALDVLKAHVRQRGSRSVVLDLQAQISAGEAVSHMVRTPADGLAEVYYGLGQALIGVGAIPDGAIYLQLALYVKPEFPFAALALASVYEKTGKYNRALAVYDGIPAAERQQPLVGIKRAVNLDQLDRSEEAEKVLVALLNTDHRALRDGKRTSGNKLSPSAPVNILRLAPFDRMLVKGSSGKSVSNLQTTLRDIGVYGGPVDGQYGSTTIAAVKRLQSGNGLNPDGVYGPKAHAALSSVVKQRNAQRAGSKNTASSNALKKAAKDRRLAYETSVLSVLGNIMRNRKRFGEALKYYSRIIESIEKPNRNHWSYYYYRGTSYERVKKWPLAEADLLKALELNPNQPQVLNYLGYSWVDQSLNLEKGMALIEKAVRLKPGDGYIVDSLGWAHFRLGNYTEAVRYLERAVELRPEDPILNDHLGDAFWRVNRTTEAGFQWNQSLTLKPEPGNATKTKKKLVSGLPPTKQAEAKVSTTPQKN